VTASRSGVLRLALGRIRSRALAQDDNGYKEGSFDSRVVAYAPARSAQDDNGYKDGRVAKASGGVYARKPLLGAYEIKQRISLTWT
jgi:hypothetical protein